MKNILRISIFFIVVGVGSFFLQSCGSKKEVLKQAETVDLSGNWSLKTLKGKDVATLFKGDIPSMSLDQTKKMISGNGGCNTFSGTYTYEEGRFNAPNLISTLMMCTEENAESELLEVLSTESIVKIVGDKLTFYKQGKAIAVFDRAIDTTLLSGEWVLDSLNGDNAPTLFKDVQIPTITFFTTDKRISGIAGCNTYNASFTLDGYTLNVGAIVSTRMACLGAMQAESEFIQALSNTSYLSLKDNTLTLSKGGEAVLQFKRVND